MEPVGLVLVYRALLKQHRVDIALTFYADIGVTGVDPGLGLAEECLDGFKHLSHRNVG